MIHVDTRCLGDLIAGRFVTADGPVLRSVDPSRGGSLVLEASTSVHHVAQAAEAADTAARGWANLSLDTRWEALCRLRDALKSRESELADAICAETGKLLSEAVGEARALVARFDLVFGQVKTLLNEAQRGATLEAWMRYRPHGVVAVIGPFNYPLHLCHAHVVPALLLGNAVIVKPAETTLLSGQLYAQCALDAGLPAGVLNVVQGAGDVGAALVANPRVRGLCFTGSWETGRRILQASLDRPELLVALEMGGKNPALVLADADLRQAVHEIAVGAYLTTGQRCTCTERVLVERAVAEPLIDALAEVVRNIHYGDPRDRRSFGGPMATLAGAQRYQRALQAATGQLLDDSSPNDSGENLFQDDMSRNAAHATLLAAGTCDDGPFFVPPTLHRIDGELPGYTDTELFGPNLAITVVDDLQHALSLLRNQQHGLAASIFTADEVAFQRASAVIHSGLLHLNRTTNQASGALPFGGVGRSGNFRPAGSFAARNVVYPVASMRNPHGGFVADPRLSHLLPAPDLHQLLRRHDEERAAEQRGDDRALFPRPMAMSLPGGGRLPESERWLARLYAGDRMPQEKKPGVVDHGRSFGPWMCSVDDEPLCVLDGMSQTATVPAGFAPDEVVQALWDGDFEGALTGNPDTTTAHRTVEQFTDVLRANVPGLVEVAFANSGAEANEKALALAALHRPADARAVLAFEGSFHGRTLLSLHATFNPTKREPFTMAGFQANFALFPVARGPLDREEAPAPDGYLEAIARADLATARARFCGVDLLLDAEIAALETVHAALSSAPHVAVIIEPMQSEGGDRYASHRFFQALRLLTRACDTPLIIDEVQCGFGLSGPFAWHRSFQLVDIDGEPDTPDAVTFAKRAQVGVVMSNWRDPEPTHSHAASLVRGRVHAEIAADPSHGARVQRLVTPRLKRLAARFPELVLHPRNAGFALAFDLPSAELLPSWLGQRFWRGAVVFAAGQKTVRYRLSRAFDERAIDQLFDAMTRTAAWLLANPGRTPPAWDDLPKASPHPRAPVTIRVAEPGERDALLPQILQIEAQVYEPARRDSPDHLATAFEEGGIAVIAEDEQGRVVGSCLGAPVERFGHVQGCQTDRCWGQGNTLYSTATTVHPDLSGAGIGQRLKAAQAVAARHRYRYVTGRNRVGRADAMTRLIRKLGGVVEQRFGDQYGEQGADAIYYRIPLQPFSELEHAAINKLTLCNYVTPGVVRAVELFGALVPELPHMYLTSCRDELVDKALRVFKWRRRAAAVALTFEGSYFGHTTAAARSLSDPALHKMGAPWVDWPRLPHPADVGADAAIAVLDKTIAALGQERVLCLAIDGAHDRGDKRLPADFGPKIRAFRERTGVPLLWLGGIAELQSRARGERDSKGVVPDIHGWWTGGQAGVMHVAPQWFERKPLTFVSTWDGDELSLIRAYHQLAAELAN